uniref:Ig-like domain-containing protein n=1 Tax=Oreochromis niloticus TaxID=8128 RepID=A0A669AWV6_ORENI
GMCKRLLSDVLVSLAGLAHILCGYFSIFPSFCLEVFAPSEVAVSEGEDATLPCRSVTAGQSVKSARWRRNGKVVLQLDAKTGGITYGEDVDRSRVSIPSEWDRQADLSLTIKRVQQQDEGVYYCDIDKWERHRSAVRLRVHPQVPTPEISTSLQMALKGHLVLQRKLPYCLLIIIIMIIIIIIIIMIIIIITNEINVIF